VARARRHGGRPVFRHVDPVASEHGVDALAQAGLLGQATEQRDRLVRDAILRVIEIDADRLRGQRSPRVASSAKSVRRCHPPDLFLVRLQRLPRGARSQWQHSRHPCSFRFQKCSALSVGAAFIV